MLVSSSSKTKASPMRLVFSIYDRQVTAFDDVTALHAALRRDYGFSITAKIVDLGLSLAIATASWFHNLTNEHNSKPDPPHRPTRQRTCLPWTE
jgi:hypothetical protein